MAKSTDKGKKSTAKVSGKKTTTKEVVSKSPVTKKTTTKPEKAKEKKSPTVSKKVANKKVEIKSVKKPVKITKTEISEKKKPVSITESPVVKTPKVKKEKAAKAPEAPKVKEENVAKAPQVPKVKKEKPYEVRNDKELLGVVVSSPPPSIMKPLRAAVETPVPVTAEPVATTPEVVAPVSEDITTVPEPIVSEPVIENNTEMPEMVIVNASNISDVVNSMPDSNSNNQSIPSQHTGGVSAHAHPVVPQSTTLLTSKAITHGDSILHLINSDWRMHAWGGVPIEHIQAVIATGNAEYQYEIKTSEQGAYFLLKYGAESHRFPQDENQFIKLK